MFRTMAAIGLFCAMLSGAAHASSVTLNYEGKSVSGHGKTVTITAVPGTIQLAGGNSVPMNVKAFGFKMADVTGGTSVVDRFIAWCLDLENWLQTSSDYDVVTTPWSFTSTPGVLPTDRVQAVFDANYGADVETDSVKAAAFQLSLWNVIYDSDFDLTGGDFQATAGSAVAAQADAYLTAAMAEFAAPGSQKWGLTFFEATGNAPRSQSLVAASPVPLPAAGWMLVAGVGAMAAAGRKRRG